MLCDDLDGWGGKRAQEVGDVCMHTAFLKETPKRENEKQCEMGWEIGVKKEFQRKQ